ncbi:replicative DNA helicase [Virgibacillus halotolerans]|uniref:replicative DNA helicase n=1 Tax=Virgibacillus halotolerans TaxID=1071053 RepID=UPI00195FD856|nr:replicative DNA helicase [Virgibacillus halotolerans]MBM7601405.1 replicative DNA helicase [Virgibacillus halotolerans]
MTAIANNEAEASVLGSVLKDGILFKELLVQEAHFYYANHRRIFRAMKEVSDQNDFIDMVTVTTKLGDAITQVGGTTYLLEMVESVASTAAMKHHERLIFDAYRAKMSKTCALQFAEDPTDQALDALITKLQNFRQVGVDKQDKTTYDYLLEITDDMCFPTEEQSGFGTSFQDLDDMTGGLQRGELIIVAARPSVGKTAFALNLAAGHAANGGTSLVFSLEMGTKLLLQRMISSVGMINSQKWRNMAFSGVDYERAINAVGTISNWKLAIYDQMRTVIDIRSAIRKKVHDNPEAKHVAIIDYLQLMTPTGKHERRDLEIGEITRELKLLAVELNIPIVLLSQLSRGVESRPDKRPLMSDLRESGNIEQDADVISFLYRDDYYDRDSERKNRMEVILSKQRNGPTGTVELIFNKAYGRFGNL